MSQWWAHFSRAFSAVMLTAILGLLSYAFVQFRDVRDGVRELQVTVPIQVHDLDRRLTILEARAPLHQTGFVP